MWATSTRLNLRLRGRGIDFRSATAAQQPSSSVVYVLVCLRHQAALFDTSITHGKVTAGNEWMNEWMI